MIIEIKNQHEANIIWDKYKIIKIIPEEFITEEMVEYYWNKYKVLHNIPKKFITREMYYINFANTKDISILPETLITEDICNDYFNHTKSTKNIPKEFLHDFIIKQENYIALRNNIISKNNIDLILDNFSKIKSDTLINVINSSIINRLFCYKYFEDYQDIKHIPNQYITKNMANKYFEKYKDIKYIPEKLLNSEICNEYFKIHCNTEYIPENLINDYMKEILESFEIKGEIKNEK